MSLRGCYRTAFEFAKLLLSLDPEDPLSILLIIDSLALKSSNLLWVCNFYRTYRAEYSLDTLPNWSFNNAFYLCSLAQQSGDEEEILNCKRALISSIIMFPLATKHVFRTFKAKLTFETFKLLAETGISDAFEYCVEQIYNEVHLEIWKDSKYADYLNSALLLAEESCKVNLILYFLLWYFLFRKGGYTTIAPV